MKTLEIITHLAWIIIQIVQKLNCPYWVKTVFSVISLYMLHWKFANYSEVDIVDFQKKKRSRIFLCLMNVDQIKDLVINIYNLIKPSELIMHLKYL